MSDQKKPRYVISIDPSGSHPQLKEGDGTTGIVIFDTKEDTFICVNEVKASDFETFQLYFRGVWDVMYMYKMEYEDSVFSIEDYLVYPGHAVHHTFSRCPTCMILGYLLMKMWIHGWDYYIRPAVDVKNRWSDNIMLRLGYIEGDKKSFEHCHGKSGYHLPGLDEPLLSHHLDAMRHALHCAKLELPKNRGRLND